MKTESAFGMCALLAAVAGGVSSPALVRADDGCSIYRINVPDLDQVRRTFNDVDGLPNDGKMFCVPTSTSNWLGYMALLDFPQVFHGEPEWFSHSGYNYASSDINFLGLMMDTSPTGGTGNQGWFDGVTGWFNPNSYPDIIHASYDLPASGITPYTMYQNMKAGYLVLVCYGRYTVAPPSGNLPQRFVRGSGHCVTLTTVTNACTQISNIGYRDPGSGGDSDTTQSGYATRYINVTPRQDWFANNSTDTPDLRTYTQMAGTIGDPVYRFIDKLRIIYPVEGLSADPIDGVLSAKKYYDFNMGLASPPRHTHALPAVPNRVIGGVKHHPFLPSAAVLVGGNTGGAQEPGIYRISLIGEAPVRVSPPPTGTVTFTFGPDSNLYVGNAGQIQGLNFENPASPPVVCGLGGQTLLAVDSGEPGLGGDNQAFSLYAITRDSAGQCFMAAIPTRPGGCGPFVPQALPRDVQIPGGCEMAQTREHILLARQGFSNILQLGRAAGGGWVVEDTIGLPEAGEPRNLQVDSRGNIYYTVDGSVRVLRQGAGGWAPGTDSIWFGYQAGEFFSMNRSRQSTSFWADGPGDVNVDPEVENREIGGTVVIDCPADFNNDGFVDFFDFDAFVECFEGGACLPDNPADQARDFNHDGFVDFFDIDAFVEAFERGC